MEYEAFLSKSTFLKSLIKEVQDVEASLWELLDSDKKEQILGKLEYMQDTIVHILRVLNDVEVEILLFKVEKSEVGKKVEKDLEDLYVLLELQKRELIDIGFMSKEEITKVLDGSNSDIQGFSESSEKIRNLITTIELDGNNFEKNNSSE